MTRLHFVSTCEWLSKHKQTFAHSFKCCENCILCGQTVDTQYLILGLLWKQINSLIYQKIIVISVTSAWINGLKCDQTYNGVIMYGKI